MLLSLVVSLQVAAAPLTTLAETSGWTRTGRYEEVEQLCASFPKRYPGKVRCETFGTTPLGRKMLALVAGTPKKPVVLLQGGIHAGEIDGKDAGFWLLREVLDGKVAPGVLDAITLVFVPVFNVDGHERFGPQQRPNQRGPEEGGWRVTSQNLNLNRDYLKADAPEMGALLGLLHRFEPVLYVDLHVTDGAKFQHDVSITFEPRRVGDEGVRTWGRTLEQDVFSTLKAEGHLPVDFYPSFENDDDPQSGFASGVAPPRFGTAYWALQNRFGMLVETHSWRPYAHRVKTTFDVCAALLEQAKLHARDWQDAMVRADAGAKQLAGKTVALSWEPTGRGETIEFLGYEYVRAPSEVSGKPWVQYDESKPQVWKVPLIDELAPAVSVTAPKGYFVSASAVSVVKPRLLAHHLSFTVLDKPLRGRAVEGFRVDPIVYRGGSYEGHQVLLVKGAWSPRTEDLAVGSLWVPVDQLHALSVLELFEPLAPDSLAAWGFFNAHLEQKEYLEDYVTEAFAREQLKNPAVKAEFDAAVTDGGLGKDADARLRFFAKRHPSWDARLGLLPVFRSEQAP